MERCPACNAKLSGKAACRRCKANLGLLMYIAQQARDHHRAALSAFMRRDAEAMLFHAKRSCMLRRTPEATGLLACAAVMANDFELAVSLWKQEMK